MNSLRKASVILGLAVMPVASFAQLRIATYNLSNYTGVDRANAIQTLFFQTFEGRKFAPDAIVLQEFISQAALTTFIGVLNTAPGSPGDYAAPLFVNGNDTDSVFCYRTSRVHFLQQILVSAGSGAVNNQPRNIVRYDFRLQGYASEGGTLSFYSSHMKAGSTVDDLARRLIEAQKIRDNAEALPAARSFAVGADFNITASSETAYQEMVGSQANNAGRLFDPILSPGAWGAASFRYIHTQDPIGAGGMDDRFDQLLLSANLIDGQGMDYIGNPALSYSTSTWNDPNHSYRCWGNDGTTYNTTLKIIGNTMVGATIAQALVDAASGGGHLPVYLDLRVPPKGNVSTTMIDFGKAFRTTKPPRRTFQVLHTGNTTLWTPAGIAPLAYSFQAPTGFFAVGGNFSLAPGASPNSHELRMDTSTSGLKQGTLTVTTNDPDQPIRTIQLLGYVIPYRGR